MVVFRTIFAHTKQNNKQPEMDEVCNKGCCFFML